MPKDDSEKLPALVPDLEVVRSRAARLGYKLVLIEEADVASESTPGSLCAACGYSYMEPTEGESLLICGVEGGFGTYLKPLLKGGGFRGPETPICGPDRPKFKQHPGRKPDGSLKGGK